MVDMYVMIDDRTIHLWCARSLSGPYPVIELGHAIATLIYGGWMSYTPPCVEDKVVLECRL